MNGTVTQYDSKDVSVIVGGVFITGMADGSFVTYEKDEDDRTPTVGAQGDVVLSKTNNPLGTITIVLQQTSPQLQYLKKLANSDELFETRIIHKGAVEEKIGGTKCYIKKLPGGEFSNEATSREFQIGVLDYRND